MLKRTIYSLMIFFFLSSHHTAGDEKEVVVNNIHDHLKKVAQQMCSGELPGASGSAEDGDEILDLGRCS